MSERWERVLNRYGLATVLALFLVWWLTSGVSGSISAIQQSLHDHVAETTFFLRAICVNAAKDEGQRANCVPPTR